MKIINNDEVEKKSNEFFNAVCKRKDSLRALNRIDTLRRMREYFNSKELFLLFILIIIKPLSEIKDNENDIMNDLAYNIDNYNKDLLKIDKIILKTIEGSEDCFNSHAHYLYFYYEAVKLKLK